jgi:alpha-galactosidase
MSIASVMRNRNVTFRLLILASACTTMTCSVKRHITLSNAQLSASIRSEDGAYEIWTRELPQPVLISRVAAEVNYQWFFSNKYPTRREAESTFHDMLGVGHEVTVTFSGLTRSPELIYVLRLYDQVPFGDIEVKVRNTTHEAITVQALRSVEAVGQPLVNLGGPEKADRVLSDSFSEDRPPVRIYDLGQAPVYLGWGSFAKRVSPVQLGVGCQLIYNRESSISLLLATLTSRRWLTLLRLGVTRSGSAGNRISSYTVDSTGTTEVEKRESLRGAPAEDQIQLSLPLQPDKELASERLMFTAGSDHHGQLEVYGKAVRLLHHARIAANGPMGWWSWTAFYNRINEHDVSENADWIAKNLKPLGYDYFHIDEGYDYARGEYTRQNLTNFPHGMRRVGQMLRHLNLKLGVWTAPFEVSERAWVYKHRKEWLVHNANGKPTRIYQSGMEPLYVLDPTNPGAQKYLRQTYQTMVQDWGVQYIKLDFMDDTAIEGHYYRPNTSALEAQRIGLHVIRDAVGQNVLLDKDGSPMLNPVGILDEGRISLDTSHAFQRIKEVETGIAARYYMNRNFFISDPDAFEVSKQVGPHQESAPLSLNEAQVSIVLAALAGGLYEIGDNLTLFAEEPSRFALLKNPDLLQMVHLGRAGTPIDLMNYLPEDEQPSVFLLNESKRQAMLGVFNWTDQPRSHNVSLSDLGLRAGDTYKGFDALNHDSPVALNGGVLQLRDQRPHSVRLVKIVDTSVPATSPE